MEYIEHAEDICLWSVRETLLSSILEFWPVIIIIDNSC